MTSKTSIAFLIASCGIVAGASAQIAFTAGGTLPANLRPSGVAIADFTGDGRNDVAVTVDNPDRLLVYPGNGDGTFGAALSRQLPSGSGAGDIAAADFDGDGDVDVAVAYQNLAQVQILVNGGAGTFTLGATAAVGANPRGTQAVNIDGDADMDIAVANRDGNTVSVITNTGGGLAVATQPAGVEPRQPAFGDRDGDGDMDMAVSSHDDRTVRLFNNTGGVFTPAGTLNVPPSTRPEGLAFANISGSPLPELVVATSDDNLGFVTVYPNNGGTFGAFQNYNTIGFEPGPLVVADLDLDGDTDVIAANEDTNNIAVFTNNGGSLGTPALLATGTNPTSIAVGRLNAGQLPDIAVANRDSNNVSLFMNTGTEPTPGCDSIDFNGDGLFPDNNDLRDFLAVFAGGACPTGTCGDIDFNNDGLFPDNEDIFAFFRVFGGGACQ